MYKREKRNQFMKGRIIMKRFYNGILYDSDETVK